MCQLPAHPHQTISNDAGSFATLSRGNHHEFLAAIACHDVLVTRTIHQGTGGGLQDLITGLVAIGIVHLLEVVQVNEHHHQRPATFIGNRKFLGNTLIQIGPVEYAGQAVAARLLLKHLRLGLELLGRLLQFLGLLHGLEVLDNKRLLGTIQQGV